MEKILLATPRRSPKRAVFGYALRLCLENRTELRILAAGTQRRKWRIFPLGSGEKYIRKGRLDKFVALAENSGVSCTVIPVAGKIDLELLRYANSRKDILLAIFDRRGAWRFQQQNEKDLASQLRVPLVSVQNGRFYKGIEFIKIIKQIFMEERFMKRLWTKIFGTSKCMSEKEECTEIPVSTEVKKNNEPARLVVVGNESHFPDSVIDYGLEMAERMNYQIIALNTAPLSCNTFRMFQDSGSQLCKEFQDTSLRSAAVFEEKAKEKEIPFTHVIKFVETDEALEEIRKEFGEIGFVVSEPESEQAAYQRNENENRMTAGICVYAMR